MKRLYEGKTKDVYSLDDENILLQMKDQVTGKDGKFDPGENQVGLEMEGFADCSLRLSVHFFELLEKNGIKTHYVESDLDKKTMKVRRANFFGDGLEVIVRKKAVGSFYRRYEKYVEEGQDLDYLVEFTIKDDKNKDPLITKDAMIMLGILSENEYKEMVDMAVSITKLLEAELETKNLTLFDIKYEFGEVDGEIVLIDELSPGNMRLYDEDEYIMPLDVCGRFF